MWCDSSHQAVDFDAESKKVISVLGLGAERFLLGKPLCMGVLKELWVTGVLEHA